MLKFIAPKFLFKIEKWKWNPNYRIYVSNMGHFKNEHKQDLPIKINSKKGYCGVVVPNFGFKYAHRLVMLTWKPIPDAENLTVDHLDHNTRNNTVSNLEWVSLEENRRRASKDLYIDAAITEATLSQTVASRPAAARLIKAGKLTFTSLDEAAMWCMKQSGPELTLEQAKTKIETKIISGAKYCGRKWKRV